MVGDLMVYLYNQNANADDFLNTSGIGVLNDIISGEVTEERNGAYDLEIEYPICGSHFSDIQNGLIILCPVYPKCQKDYYQAFRIYHISQPFNGIVRISAHHISYDLNKLICQPWETTAKTLAKALEYLRLGIYYPIDQSASGDVSISNFDFKIGPDKSNVESDMELLWPKTARSILGGEEGSILDIYRGEYEFDNFEVILHQNRGRENSGISVIYKKNLLDFSKEDDIESTYDGVYPFYYSENTESNDDGEEITEKILVQINDNDKNLPAYMLYDDSDVNMSRKSLYLLDLTSNFEYVPTPEQLRKAAEEFMTENELNRKNISLSISFEDLESSTDYERYRNFESIRLCDHVTIYTPPEFGNSKLDAKCVKIVYDIISDRYSSIEVGSISGSISDTIAQSSKEVKTNSVTKKQAEALMDSKIAALMNNGNGGYVVFHRSKDASTDAELFNSSPDELLIMDTPSISTAKSIWRWNKNGLAFTDQGYNSDYYKVALTSDGTIRAEMIVGEILSGTSIRLYDSTTIGDENRTGTFIDKNGFISFYQGRPVLSISQGQSIFSRIKIQNDTEFGNKVRFQPVDDGLDIIFL